MGIMNFNNAQTFAQQDHMLMQNKQFKNMVDCRFELKTLLAKNPKYKAIALDALKNLSSCEASSSLIESPIAYLGRKISNYKANDNNQMLPAKQEALNVQNSVQKLFNAYSDVCNDQELAAKVKAHTDARKAYKSETAENLKVAIAQLGLKDAPNDERVIEAFQAEAEKVITSSKYCNETVDYVLDYKPRYVLAYEVK